MANQEMEIRMTDTQLAQLEVFLSRVNLNAKEVMAFTEILNEIKHAMPATSERITIDELN